MPVAIKYTFLFELATNAGVPNAARHRIGGWSESWYDISDTGAIFPASIRNWSTARAKLLPAGASIVGYRTQAVDPVGASSTGALSFPGNPLYPSDIPQMALQCKATGQGVRNVRTFTLRGIPDGQVTQGEYTPVAPFDVDLAKFLTYLNSGNWEFRGRNLANVAHPLVSIDANGICVFAEPHGLVVGDYVRVLRAVLPTKQQVGGRFYVATQNTLTTCAITGWTFGATTGGKGRKDAIVYPSVAVASFDRIITRRVGRPFTGYRGRRSKRK